MQDLHTRTLVKPCVQWPLMADLSRPELIPGTLLCNVSTPQFQGAVEMSRMRLGLERPGRF